MNSNYYAEMRQQFLNLFENVEKVYCRRPIKRQFFIFIGLQLFIEMAFPSSSTHLKFDYDHQQKFHNNFNNVRCDAMWWPMLLFWKSDLIIDASDTSLEFLILLIFDFN